MSETEPDRPTATTLVGDTVQRPSGPAIPDYELVRQIGTGAFGEVWLARSHATGRYRAIKFVYRDRLQSPRTFDLEFNGLRKFEEVSRQHLGFVDILHISRHEAEGYFYYVMELADDVARGQQIAEATYTAQTLATRLGRQGRLPAAECVRVGLALTEALGELHRRGLVHRDLKPANIVFVRGSPKLADIGLVTEATPQPQTTLVGTPGYMDLKVHGTVAGDLYSLGKLLYVMATGLTTRDWPTRPKEAATFSDFEDVLELERIFQRACHEDPGQRYSSAQQIQQDLLPLRLSAPLRRLERLARLFASIRRYAVPAVGLLFLAVLAGYQWVQVLRHRADLRHRQVGSYVAHGNRYADDLDLLGSLPAFVEALRLDRDEGVNGETHRLRVGTVLKNAPTIVQMWFGSPGAGYAAFAGQEDRLLAPTLGGRWAILALDTGRPVGPPFGTSHGQESASLSVAAGLAVTSTESTNVVRLWEVPTGREIHQFHHLTNVSAAVISPDGRWVAAALADCSVVLWNTPTRQQGPVLTGHTNAILHLHFSHDSRRLASGGIDHLAAVWDLASGRAVRWLTNHTSWIYDVSFSHDDQFLATASFDRTARLWDVARGVEVVSPLRHNDGIYSVEFRADDQQVVTACLDFTVRTWDRTTGRLLQTLRHESKPVYAGFSPDGHQIVTATHDGTIRVWNLQPRQDLEDVPALGWSPSSRHLVRETQGMLQVLDLLDPGAGRLFPLGQRRGLRAWLNDQADKMLVACVSNPPVAASAAEVEWWDCRTGRVGPHPIRLSLPLPELVLNPGGTALAVLEDRQVSVWDLEAGRPTWRLDGPAQRAAFDPSGQRLALASGSQVTIWHLASATRQPRHPLTHPVAVESVVWSHQGRYLLTACRDNSFQPEAARLWDAQTGRLVGHPLKHRDGLCFAAFSPDDTEVVTCGEDFVAILWRTATSAQLAPPLVHKHQVWHAAFSRDGRWLATACRDGTVRLWDAANGEPITPPLSLPEQARFVQPLGDGRLLVARNEQGLVRVWHLAPDPRPLADLIQVSELLSAQQSGAIEAMRSPSRNDLRRTWEQLRHKYPADFSPAARPAGDSGPGR